MYPRLTPSFVFIYHSQIIALLLSSKTLYDGDDLISRGVSERLPGNTDNAFHAAQAAGCQRVVYASSVNAVLGYEGVGREGEATGSAWDAPVMPT